MNQKLKGSHQRAFTLIELMVVLTLISILWAVAIPNLTAYKTKAHNIRADINARYDLTLPQGRLITDPDGPTPDNELIASFASEDGDEAEFLIRCEKDRGSVFYRFTSSSYDLYFIGKKE